MTHVQMAINWNALLSGLVGLIPAIFRGLSRLSGDILRVRKMERLLRASDAELAEIGLTRKDIVPHFLQRV